MSRRIDYENGYVLDIDEGSNRNYTLKKNVRAETKINDKGEEKVVENSTILGYYSSLPSSTNAMFEDMTVSQLEKTQTIEEAVKIVKRVERKINKIIKKFEIGG